MRNQVTQKIRTAKAEYEYKIAEKIKYDSKSFYAYVREKSKSKVKVGPLVDNMGGVVDGKKEMVTLLNKFFASVFTVERVATIPAASKKAKGGDDGTIADILISEKEVMEAIRRLKENKGAGVDGINSTFLKHCTSLVKPLVKLFQESFDSGRIPSEWKMANVTPIFKKGKKSNPENYQPVSLTSRCVS